MVMNRLDLARKQVALMQQSDDDATLTKLAGAWAGMAEGASNVSSPEVFQPARPWDALSSTPNAPWSSNVIVATVAPP